LPRSDLSTELFSKQTVVPIVGDIVFDELFNETIGDRQLLDL
jgi:hypothetical protein